MRISVSVEDGVIIVDGVARACAFTAPEGVRAIHWDGTSGHFEFADRLEHFTRESRMDAYLAAWRTAIVSEGE
jgi:hypothetical protein